MAETEQSARERTEAAVSFVTTEHFTLANRIAWLRAFYFELAPELDAYLLSVRPERRLIIQGSPEGFWQNFVTIAGMIAVITSVLAGAGVALLVAVVANHSLTAALAAGGAVTIAALVAMMRHQHLAWTQLWQPAESLP